MSSIEIDVTADIAKFKSALERAAAEGSKLNKSLSRSFKTIGNVMKGVGALAGVAVAGGLATMAKSSIDAADSIQKLGVRTGASARFLSEMRVAISQSDVSSKEFANSLVKLNKSTQDAADGLSTPSRAFQKLGIDVQQFTNLNTDQKFVQLSQAISQIKDPAVRSQTAMDLLGRSGSQLLTVMEGGAAGIENYRDKAIELGQSLSQDQVDAAAAANDALDLLSKSISGSFSQAILGYTDEIKKAADFTREYLPRSIEFLMDIFRGLKAVVQGVALSILSSFKKIAEAASQLPLVGDKFKGTAKFFGEAADIIKTQLAENVNNMGKWRDSGKKLNAELKKVEKGFSDAGSTISKINPRLQTAAEKKAAATKEAKRLAASIKALEAAGKDFSDNIPTKAVDRLKDALKEVRTETTETRLNFGAFNEALTDGTIKTVEEAREVAQKLGLDLKQLGLDTEESTGIMTDAFRQFADYSFDAMRNFWDGLVTGTKNSTQSTKDFFKDMVSNILAQITKLIASNAWKKFLNFVLGDKYGSNVGFFDGVVGAFTGSSNGGVSGAGSQAVSTAVSSGVTEALTGTQLGNAVGLGSGSGTIVGNGINTVFGGTSGSTVVGNAINSGAATVSEGLSSLGSSISSALGLSTAGFTTAGTAIGSTTATAVLTATESLAATAAAQTAAVNALPAAVGVATAGAVATGFTAAGAATAVASTGGVGVSAAIGSAFTGGAAAGAGAGAGAAAAGGAGAAGAGSAALTATGWGAVIVAAIALLSGNSRSPQQIGLDQLQSVDSATRQGRNQQVANLRGSGVSFLGGFNEASTFFGAAGVSDSDLDQVGEILKQRYGFDQAFGLKDGILRLVDEDRKFSQNHDQITTEVLTAMAEVQLSIVTTEVEAIKSFGSMAVKADAAFDAITDSSLSATDKVTLALSTTYGIGADAAEQMVVDSGISATRLAEIFQATSGDVLTSMVGAADRSGESFADMSNVVRVNFGDATNYVNSEVDSVVANLAIARSRVEGSWNGLSLGQLQPIEIRIDQVAGSTVQAANSGQSQQAVVVQPQNDDAINNLAAKIEESTASTDRLVAVAIGN